MRALPVLCSLALAVVVEGGPTPPPFVCPKTSGLFPNIYDCTSYYTCDFGVATLESCPPSLQYNRVLEVCEFPEDIQPPCVPEQVTTPSPPLEEERGLPPFTCPSQFGLYPDVYDCTCYFQCSYGVPYVEHCPPGLLYNKVAMACDYPANIHPPCVPEPYPTTTAKPPTAEVEVVTTTPTPPHPSPYFDCPSQFGLYPDIYDCGSYFQCSYGVAFLEHCQPGLQFNPAKLYCDYPANINPPCVPVPYPSTTPAQ